MKYVIVWYFSMMPSRSRYVKGNHVDCFILLNIALRCSCQLTMCACSIYVYNIIYYLYFPSNGAARRTGKNAAHVGDYKQQIDKRFDRRPNWKEIPSLNDFLSTPQYSGYLILLQCLKISSHNFVYWWISTRFGQI